MKILRITLTILILGLLPFVVFTLITSKTPILGGIQSFVVLTGSMGSSIPQGSIIFTQKTPFYNKGDVISFEKGSNTVTHRITDVRVKNNALHYQTKGDTNNTVDQELVAREDVLGKSVFFVPFVGQLVLFLKTFQGYALLIIFPTVFFVVFELNNIRKEIMKEAEKRAREEWKNSKFEALNSKQIQMTEIQT